MQTLTEGREEIWLIVSEAELWDARGLAQDWLASHGTLLERRSFARVDAYLYSLHNEEAGRDQRGLPGAACVLCQRDPILWSPGQP